MGKITNSVEFQKLSPLSTKQLLSSRITVSFFFELEEYKKATYSHYACIVDNSTNFQAQRGKNSWDVK